MNSFSDTYQTWQEPRRIAQDIGGSGASLRAEQQRLAVKYHPDANRAGAMAAEHTASRQRTGR